VNSDEEFLLIKSL